MCRRPAPRTYLTRALCDWHWGRVCELSRAGKAKHLAQLLQLPFERIKRILDHTEPTMNEVEAHDGDDP